MMDLYQILTICGVGALTSSVIIAIVESVKNRIKKHGEKQEQDRQEKERQREEAILSIDNKLSEVSIKIDCRIDQLNERIDSLDGHMKQNTDKGVQALLRNKLYEIYDFWVPKGYAPTDVKENFQNLYTVYHQLGKNGVMDTKRDILLALPDIKTSTRQTLRS